VSGFVVFRAGVSEADNQKFHGIKEGVKIQIPVS
jgi:hypothetical protein